MSKPRLLDLFCGAGGAAVGYHRAGFEVVGVDNRPQPHYPFEFWRQEALWTIEEQLKIAGEWGWKFAAIHASPPCQHYANVTRWRGDQDDHPDLIGPTRELLEQTGLPYVIENVPDARDELRFPVAINGDDVGLPIRRERLFEANWPLRIFELALRHERRLPFDHGGTVPESEYRSAMGCDWMTVEESREAIPPAYTELIGHQLMQRLKAGGAA